MIFLALLALSTGVGYAHADLFALPIPQFGSPGINVNPQNLSFNMDSPDYEWERIDICIYNPPTYNIERATITLDIPETIDYKVSTDLPSIFRYDPLKITFTIENFGNYNESVQCDWFEIRPRIDSLSKKDTIHLSYNIEYSRNIFSLNNHTSNSANITQIEINSITQNDSTIENRNQNSYDNENFSLIGTIGNIGNNSIERNSVTRDDNISILIKKTENGTSSIIQDNVWFIAVASLFCSIILLIFGPGNEQRIESIRRMFRK
ncbi:MAG: hypothetical protein BWY93_00133 [Euryarchaeota archaeon ADurb.BinA087]|nr:MAG: hypothetical protein BWY93_00133 [Euryarchaeota archaeon ADurb.BinA087]